MNYLLSLNKVYVLFIILLICSIFFIFLVFQIYFKNENNIINKIEISNVDITEPKFSINNNSKKIFVTAKEGNFLKNDKILLRKNVKFKSDDFSLLSDNVTFDRKKQTAFSEEKSLFKSKNTTISSEGFNIMEEGNKINFVGNSTIILK